MTTEYVTIPKDEYDFLLSCKQQLIDIHNAEIQRCRNEMQENMVGTIVSQM